MLPHNVDRAANEWATGRLKELEDHFQADGFTMMGPIFHGLENQVRAVLNELEDKQDTILVILDTSGGIAEVTERIARIFRAYYDEVIFLVPDRALSAGTVLVMSGDAIWMDYHSCLGPIDPQISRDGRLIPALSYLAQYERLREKAKKGELSTADVVLLQKLDLAELHQFELARDLSVSLLKEWLATYKFKDWTVTETRGKKVTPAMRKQRAEEIAAQLSDHERWHTHGRGIDMRTLQEELNLKIDDYGADSDLQHKVWNYFWFMKDFMNRRNYTTFLHTRNFF